MMIMIRPRKASMEGSRCFSLPYRDGYFFGTETVMFRNIKPPV